MYKVTEIKGTALMLNLKGDKTLRLDAKQSVELSDTLVEDSPELTSAINQGLIKAVKVVNTDNTNKKGGKNR